ncbi:spore coat protein [Pelomyxa schiedti]|nr:spore coat protein [Pelomyxa schiedti]
MLLLCVVVVLLLLTSVSLGAMMDMCAPPPAPTGQICPQPITSLRPDYSNPFYELPIPVVAKPVCRGRYEISVVECSQQIHLDLQGKTPLFCYDGLYPGPTIEAIVGEKIEIQFNNKLPINHILPVDVTIHGACDVPEVRIITHLHGGHTLPQYDGYPEDWYPHGYSKTHTFYNDQPPTTLWYHDHALGITRLNVYAGLAAFYILRERNEPSLLLPHHQYEVPLVIQDRSFYESGVLFYPYGPVPPDVNCPYTTTEGTTIWPSGVPEFFGNTILVNGKAWPFMNVESRLYRFRLLNGCDSRSLILKLSYGNSYLPINVIGSDQGFLTHPVAVQELLMGPSERYDILVDFSDLPVGSEILLKNIGPDGPLMKLDMVEAADTATTGQVMLFKVTAPAKDSSRSKIPTQLDSPPIPTAVTNTRRVELFESQDMYGRLKLMLGPEGSPMNWDDPITENPELGSVEKWQIINTTPDTHPIHLHLVRFFITGFTTLDGTPLPQFLLDHQRGPKDVVMVPPQTVASVVAQFDILGRYVWHCHILEHEDNEMMRPFDVIKVPEELL